jgi:hypothetical protein
VRRPLLQALFLPLLVLGAPGCGDDLVDEDEGPVPETEVPVERRGVIPLRQGYLDGQTLEYYFMGSLVPSELAWFPSYDKFPGMPTRELYVFADAAGKPSLDGTGRPIVDHLPLQASASDFLEVVVVRAPPGHAVDQIKSRATLLRAGYALERTGLTVNCPIVGANASLGGSPPAGVRKLSLWYRKQSTQCLLLDGGLVLGVAGGLPPPKKFITAISPERSEVRVAPGDVYLLRASAFTGADLATAIPVPKNDIFRYAPGHAEYTPLAKIWDVTVPSDYQVGGLTSYAALFPVPDFTDPRITARSPEAFCNCPVVRVGK